jgi:hypothetical protein
MPAYRVLTIFNICVLVLPVIRIVKRLVMSRVAGRLLRFLRVLLIPEVETIPDVGTLVRIRSSAKNPLAGHTGTIIAIASGDPYGPYLVEFESRLRFRYRASEFSVETCADVVKDNSARRQAGRPCPGRMGS